MKLNKIAEIIQIKKYKENKLYIFLAIYIIAINLNMTAVGMYAVMESITKIIRYVCYFAFVFKFIYDWKKGKLSISWVLIASFLIALMVAIKSHNIYLIIFPIILTVFKNEKMEKIIKVSYHVNLIMYILIITLSIANIIPNWEYLRSEGEFRYSLGYHYPTITSTYLFFILLMDLYIHKNKIPYYKIALYSILAITIYMYTDSRTGFILSLLVIISMIICKIKKEYKGKNALKKCFDILSICLPIAMLVITVIFVLLYRNNVDISIKVNNLLSNRLGYTNDAFNNYGLEPFGQNIKWYGWGGYNHVEIDENYKYNFVDNAYMKLLFDYGYVYLILFIIMFTVSMKYYVKNNDKYMIYILSLISIWSLIEPNILDIGINTFILTLGKIYDYFIIKNLDCDNIVKLLKGEKK